MRDLWLTVLTVVIGNACGFAPPSITTTERFIQRPFNTIRHGTSGTDASSFEQQQQGDVDDDSQQFFFEIATKLRTSIHSGYSSKDPAYGIENFVVDIPIEPSLGLELIEVAHSTTDPNGGLVLISGVTGNAAVATSTDINKKIQKGDTIVGVSCGGESSYKQSTTGLDYDSTMDTIIQAKTNAELLREDCIRVEINRLVQRAPVQVMVVDTKKTKESVTKLQGLAGDNLRLLLKQNNVYYCTNDCGGEGICGSDVIEILEGEEFVDYLGPSTRRKRKACQTVVGRNNQRCKIKIRCCFGESLVASDGED